MIIVENLKSRKKLEVLFYNRRRVIFEKLIILSSNPQKNAEARISLVREFTRKNKEFDFRTVLKLYGRVNSEVKSEYKKLYPKGGWHGGGRPQGSKNKNPKTEYTERLYCKVSKQEKEYIKQWLKSNRSSNKTANEAISEG